MIALNHFNQLSGDHAVAVLEPCVAVSGWAAALAAGRPWRSRADLLSAAERLMAEARSSDTVARSAAGAGRLRPGRALLPVSGVAPAVPAPASSRRLPAHAVYVQQIP